MKQLPHCPLCQYSIDPQFIEGIPGDIIAKDQEVANLLLKLECMELGEKIAIAESLMWTHHFEVTAVVDAVIALLDGHASSIFFRTDGEFSH